MVGCVRVLPPAEAESGFAESLLGVAGYEDLLSRLGARRAATAEAGCLMTRAEYRDGSLAGLLAGGAAALARALGYELLLLPVVTWGGLDRRLARRGLEEAPGVGPLVCRATNDELRVLVARTAAPAPHCARLVDHMAAVLALPGRPHPPGVALPHLPAGSGNGSGHFPGPHCRLLPA
jgi:hypothetical protein